MKSQNARPKFLTAHAVADINKVEDPKEVIDTKPVMQILQVKDVRNKKNMKDKLTISDGLHKMLCIVKEKVNTTAQNAYKEFDVIRLNKFIVKEVGSVKVVIPNEDFDIISNDIAEIIGNPKSFDKTNTGTEMEAEFEIPYKIVETKEPPKEESKEESIDFSDNEDVDMNETPIKQEDQEVLPQESPSPMKEDSVADDEDDIYTPIKALSPMNSDWIIKARVSKKYPVKEWTNARGAGKLLNFELVDKYGTQIQATLFNKAVDKFDSVLEQDKVYIFCKGQVKVANQKFTAIKNDYSLTFSPFSEITLTQDDAKISKVAFNFTSLREVKTKGEGKALDFVGIVVSCSETTTINLKSGGTKDKRDYEVIDNSMDGGLRTIISLWGLPAKKYTFAPGTVVAFKGLRVTNFKGLTLNGGDYTGVHEAQKLGLKEARALTAWYRTVKDNLSSITSLTETDEGEKKSSFSNVRLIGEINENVDTDLVNNPQVRYYVNGLVEMIRNDPKMVYMACPSCKKKMNEEDSGYSSWRCERCDMTTAEPVPTYLLSVKLTDSTGSIWTRVHGDSAIPIMGNMKPEKFKNYLDLGDESRDQEIKDQLSAFNFKQFSVMLKPSMSEYNGQQSLNFFASKVYDYSFKKNNDFLIQRLKTFSEKADRT